MTDFDLLRATVLTVSRVDRWGSALTLVVAVIEMVLKVVATNFLLVFSSRISRRDMTDLDVVY